ncbi:MAG: hypothetical protein Q7J54_04045 [Candidatus Woesearchaeota archaeon]|nr:hypothetical protein [Candidatus Woesearchaeota archaeon]
MRSLVFDSGPIISLSVNSLLWIMEKLKENFKGEFYIANMIKYELVDRPLNTKRFEFEAIQVLDLINKGVLNVVENEKIKNKGMELLDLANHCFTAQNNYINIVHLGDAMSIAATIVLDAEALIIDERTVRLLIENPERLAKLLKNKLNTKIEINKEALSKFRKETENLKIIRSVELIAVAYELGFLDKYIIKTIPEPEKTLLDAVLWGLKVRGCAVSSKEINKIIKIETRK